MIHPRAFFYAIWLLVSEPFIWARARWHNHHN